MYRHSNRLKKDWKPRRKKTNEQDKSYDQTMTRQKREMHDCQGHEELSKPTCHQRPHMKLRDHFSRIRLASHKEAGIPSAKRKPEPSRWMCELAQPLRRDLQYFAKSRGHGPYGLEVLLQEEFSPSPSGDSAKMSIAVMYVM